MAELIINNNKRVVFPQGELRVFLATVENSSHMHPDELAKLVGVSSRTYRDWKREKYLIALDSLQLLSDTFKLPIPKNIQVRDQYWYTKLGAQKGGKTNFEKHKTVGGDPRIRIQQWKKWWDTKGKFLKNPALQRKNIVLPSLSADLAEFVGILLGDGGMSRHQITITLHWEDDREFLVFVRNLCARLFALELKIVRRPKSNVGLVTISRIALVEFFLKMNLVVGNKVRQQVQVPLWIQDNAEYAKRCVRGLIDTDGCFYIDRHRSPNKEYAHAGIAFTNRSIPLLTFVKENLTKYGFHPTHKTPYTIFLRRGNEIDRYFKEIGSSNPKHFKKYQKYAILRDTNGGVPKRS